MVVGQTALDGSAGRRDGGTSRVQLAMTMGLFSGLIYREMFVAARCRPG